MNQRYILERMVYIANINLTYNQIVSNGSNRSVDKMGTGNLRPYQKLHKHELIKSLLNEIYHFNPAR